MKQNITPHDIANTARMMRYQRPGAFLIVEGDTDARVYGRFIDRVHCEIIPAHGKDNALIAIRYLEKYDFSGVLAIVDNDFWRLEDIAPDSEHVLITDKHDLETMILSSDALDAVITEFGSKRRIEKLAKPVRETILDAGLPIGYFRWMSTSAQDNLLLNFSDIRFSIVITVRDGALMTEVDTLIREVRFRSHNTMPPREQIGKRLLSLIKSAEHDPWQVCSGHDLVHILSIGLRELFGGRSAKNITYAVIDRIIRIAYSFREFRRTELYASIKKWEKQNKGYKVLN